MTSPVDPLELTPEQAVQSFGAELADMPAHPTGKGGRQVLAWTLTILTILWIGYTGWAAGQALAGQPLSAPQVAQWLSIAAGPLALFGLAWLTFGRTRRKEAERFTRSVIAMRHEAQSLEALLEVLWQRNRRQPCRAHRGHAAADGAWRQCHVTARRNYARVRQQQRKAHQAWRRAGPSCANGAYRHCRAARGSTPRRADRSRFDRAIARSGQRVGSRAVQLGQQVNDLAQRTREADGLIGEAVDRMAARLNEIETAGANAAARVGEADASFKGALDTLFERASSSLEEIRTGIDAQAAAVAALVSQSSAGIGKAGADSAEALASHVDHANSALEGLSDKVAEQERASQRMIAEIDRGLVLIDQRFTQLASQGGRTRHAFPQFARPGACRARPPGCPGDVARQCLGIARRANRNAARQYRSADGKIREGAGIAIGEAQGGADRLAETAATFVPTSIRSATQSSRQATNCR